jgi:hypothetical protein
VSVRCGVWCGGACGGCGGWGGRGASGAGEKTMKVQVAIDLWLMEG